LHSAVTPLLCAPLLEPLLCAPLLRYSARRYSLLRAHSRLHHQPYYTPTVTHLTTGLHHPLLHPNSHTRLEAGRALAQGRHSTPLPTLGATIIAHTTPQQSHAPRSRQGSCTAPSLRYSARRYSSRYSGSTTTHSRLHHHPYYTPTVTRASKQAGLLHRAVTPRPGAPGPAPPQPRGLGRRRGLESSRYASRHSTPLRAGADPA
jgi:hypothetical protein